MDRVHQPELVLAHVADGNTAKHVRAVHGPAHEVEKSRRCPLPGAGSSAFALAFGSAAPRILQVRGEARGARAGIHQPRRRVLRRGTLPLVVRVVVVVAAAALRRGPAPREIPLHFPLLPRRGVAQLRPEELAFAAEALDGGRHLVSVRGRRARRAVPPLAVGHLPLHLAAELERLAARGAQLLLQLHRLHRRPRRALVRVQRRRLRDVPFLHRQSQRVVPRANRRGRAGVAVPQTRNLVGARVAFRREPLILFRQRLHELLLLVEPALKRHALARHVVDDAMQRLDLGNLARELRASLVLRPPGGPPAPGKETIVSFLFVSFRASRGRRDARVALVDGARRIQEPRRTKEFRRALDRGRERLRGRRSGFERGRERRRLEVVVRDFTDERVADSRRFGRRVFFFRVRRVPGGPRVRRERPGRVAERGGTRRVECLRGSRRREVLVRQRGVRGRKPPRARVRVRGVAPRDGRFLGTRARRGRRRVLDRRRRRNVPSRHGNACVGVRFRRRRDHRGCRLRDSRGPRLRLVDGHRLLLGFLRARGFECLELRPTLRRRRGLTRHGAPGATRPPPARRPGVRAPTRASQWRGGRRGVRMTSSWKRRANIASARGSPKPRSRVTCDVISLLVSGEISPRSSRRRQGRAPTRKPYLSDNTEKRPTK